MPNEIKPEQVPKESLVAYQRAFKGGGGPADGIAAALSAWPGMKLTPWWEFTTHKRRVDLVLPLPEKVDG